MPVDDGAVEDEPQGVDRFVGAPRMNSVVRDLLGDIPEDFSVRIEKVRPCEGGWTLIDDAGFEFEGFDLVVVAVPPAQALPLVEASTELVAAISGVKMWPCHATMLAFESPIAVEFDGAHLESESVAWAARNDSKAERGDETCWVLQSRPDWSEAHLDSDPESVGSHMESEFARAAGVTLPPIHYRATHRWLYSRPASSLEGATLFDRKAGLAICGDWLRGEKVEAAFLAAEELADAILPAIGHG